jgi:hypothetical protein
MSTARFISDYAMELDVSAEDGTEDAEDARRTYLRSGSRSVLRVRLRPVGRAEDVPAMSCAGRIARAEDRTEECATHARTRGMRVFPRPNAE